MKAENRWIALTLLFVLQQAFAAGMALEVIPLQNRTVEDVIPVIRPLLPAGASVSGMNNQLVIKSTPESIAEVKELLLSIDHRLRRLLITVKQDAQTQSLDTGRAISGHFDDGEVIVESEDQRQRRGASVTVGDENGDHLRYRTLSERDTGDEGNSFRVQTVEGQAAFIESGLSVPIPQRNVAVVPGTVVVQDTVQYYDAASGFYVLPRVTGDNVMLLVSPYMTRIEPGRLPVFDVQSAETTLSGRLGEWIPLGGIEQESYHTGREDLATTSHQAAETRNILIKVDEIE